MNVFALGVCRQEEILYASASGIGNPVIYVGARTGRDGIHGASMASAEFTEESQQKRPNVQVGDPFLEKLLLEACLEAMKTGAIVGIQDMGAAGLTSSSCEMGSRGGVGIEIDLDRVPQRETGMTAYEMMLSESQERMLLVTQSGREEEIFRIFRKWGLEAVIIGSVTGDGLLRVRHRGEVVAEIPNRAIADEAPRYDRPRAAPFRTAPMDPPSFNFGDRDFTADLQVMLASPDLCSKRWIWEQYDYTVRTNTIVGPGSDCAIIRVKENGTSLAISLDGNGRYCYLSPREGARLNVAEACRNLATSGAQPVAATNNLNFGNPERPEIMGQLVEAIEGMAEACAYFETPITGGNVSLYNETLGEAIYPTPVVGIVGMMKTAEPVPLRFQNAGREIVLIGGVGDSDSVRFGSSQFAKTIVKQLWGLPPALDMDYEKRVHGAIREIHAAGLAESAHDLSDGGLAVALAECTTAKIGAQVSLESELDPALLLFHEGPSRILISTAGADRVIEICTFAGIACPVIGVTIELRLEIFHRHRTLIDAAVDGLSSPGLEHHLDRV